MITTTSGMHYHQLKIHGWQIGGSVVYLLTFWKSHRLMHFWFYATFYTVGYVRRERLRYWSFVGSWRGNLLNIYIFGNSRGGGSYYRNPFICWWLRQVTREDIRVGGGFALKNLPIDSTTAALSAEKDKNILRMHPGVWIFSYCNVQHVLIASSDD